MTKDAMFTLKLEAELRDQFMAAAAAAHRPASQIVREFMRDFVQRQRDARAHDAWVRAEIEKGLRDADDPTVHRIPHDKVAEDWHRRRAALSVQAGDPAE
jgi:predicted transcriptional regulator